jgi:hypothetical protein
MRFPVIVTSKDIFFWVIMTPSSLGGTYFLLKEEAAGPCERLTTKCESLLVRNIGGKDP